MEQDTPIRTGIPLLVEAAGDIANTVDFHVSSTNWINVIDNFINHVASVYVWNYTKHTPDPIIHQARFFRSMNQGALPLKYDGRGGVDYKVIGVTPSGTDRSTYDGTYLSKLDTLLQSTWVWVRTDEGLPETRTGPSGNTEYHAYDIANRADVWLEYPYDTREVTFDRIANLETAWGMENLESDQEFLMYWTKKYRRSHNTIKQAFTGLLVEMNVSETDNYFTSISDSIGLLSRVTYYPDTSVIPKMDIEFGLIEELSDPEHVATAPFMHPPVIDDKIDDETKDMLTEFSLRTNMLFRTNQAVLFRAVGSPSNSHGEDMVNDFTHFNRMYMLRGELEGQVNEILGKVHTMVGYMQIAANNQEIDNPIIDLVVEDAVVRVDILKNKYHTLASALTSRSQNDDILKYKVVTRDPS